MGVHVIIGEGFGRFTFGRAVIKVPVFAAGDEGVVRVGKADGQAPRARVSPAGEVVKFLAGLMGHVVVVFQLVGDLGHARARHRPQVVIPPVDPFPRFAIVRGPAEIGRVNVGGQAFLKAVKLVGADKMHLAAKGSLVSGAAQVVGIGRDVRGKLGRIVIDARAGGKLPGHEAGPRRRAKRRGAIAVRKAGGPCGKALQVRGVQELGRAVGEKRPGQLVNHQDQDVRLVGHWQEPGAREAVSP